MEFVFTDEQAMIAETARAFFSENATSERTRKAMAADGIDAELWTAFCQELGLSGIGIPRSLDAQRARGRTPQARSSLVLIIARFVRYAQPQPRAARRLLKQSRQ